MTAKTNDLQTTLVCEICGAQATAFVTDEKETTKPEDAFRNFAIHSRHLFCNTHRREPITYPSDYWPTI